MFAALRIFIGGLSPRQLASIVGIAAVAFCVVWFAKSQRGIERAKWERLNEKNIALTAEVKTLADNATKNAQQKSDSIDADTSAKKERVKSTTAQIKQETQNALQPTVVAAYPVPVGFVRSIDAAALQLPKGPETDMDRRPAKAGIDRVGGSIVENYGRFHIVLAERNDCRQKYKAVFDESEAFLAAAARKSQEAR